MYVCVFGDHVSPKGTPYLLGIPYLKTYPRGFFKKVMVLFVGPMREPILNTNTHAQNIYTLGPKLGPFIPFDQPSGQALSSAACPQCDGGCKEETKNRIGWRVFEIHSGGSKVAFGTWVHRAFPQLAGRVSSVLDFPRPSSCRKPVARFRGHRGP